MLGAQRKSTETERGLTFWLPRRSPHLFTAHGCPPTGQLPAGRGRISQVCRTSLEPGTALCSQVPIKSLWRARKWGNTGLGEVLGNLLEAGSG